MSRTASRTASPAGPHRFEQVVVAVAVLVLLVPVGLVASSVAGAAAEVIRDAFVHEDGLCTTRMSPVLPPHGPLVCAPVDRRLPRGWVRLERLER